MTNTNKKISYDGTQITAFQVDFSQVDNRAGQDDVAIQYDADESRIGGHLKVVVRHEQITWDDRTWEDQEKLVEDIKFTALMVAQRRLAEMTVSSVDSIFYFENIKLEGDTFAESPIREVQDLNWTLSTYLQKDGSGSNMEVLLVNYEPRTVKRHETNYKGGRHSNRRAGLVYENVAQEFMQIGYCNIPAGIGWSELVQAHPSDLGNAQLFGPQVELPSILPLSAE